MLTTAPTPASTSASPHEYHIRVSLSEGLMFLSPLKMRTRMNCAVPTTTMSKLTSEIKAPIRVRDMGHLLQSGAGKRDTALAVPTELVALPTEVLQETKCPFSANLLTV